MNKTNDHAEPTKSRKLKKQTKNTNSIECEKGFYLLLYSLNTPSPSTFTHHLTHLRTKIMIFPRAVIYLTILSHLPSHPASAGLGYQPYYYL